MIIAIEVESDLVGIYAQFAHTALRRQPSRRRLRIIDKMSGEHAVGVAELVAHLVDAARSQQLAAIHHAERTTHFGELAEDVGTDDHRGSMIRDLAERHAQVTARERIKELLQRRIDTQPLNLPNAGSVFRNPDGDHAARLIESCGLKGRTIGGARVSEKHANFIVNPGGAGSAADIEALIAEVRATVRERTGIELEPEVRIIGERAA